MTPHAKKLIGAVLMVLWLIVYALMASAFAVRILPGARWYVSLAFYALAGSLWIVPVGFSLPWMYRQPTAKRPAAEPGPDTPGTGG